jgi:uncharacterized LabA/DUF88 family protein
MPEEKSYKRVIAFVDGQNLFYAAKQAFGYTYPNYDAIKLSQLTCDKYGTIQNINCKLVKLYFYTGMPLQDVDATKNRFWKSKLAAMGRNEIVSTFSRPLVCREGIWQEKGIDVRLALDAIRLAHQNEYDIALIFSQDQDFSELAIDIERVALAQKRQITAISAYPNSANSTNKKGIYKTYWFKVDKNLYDIAIDHYDYRKRVMKK